MCGPRWGPDPQPSAPAHPHGSHIAPARSHVVRWGRAGRASAGGWRTWEEMKQTGYLSTKHRRPSALQLLQQWLGGGWMGNGWRMRPQAVGLRIWHHPSRGADPSCPGHRRLARLAPHCTGACHGNSWGLGGRCGPSLPGRAEMDGLQAMCQEAPSPLLPGVCRGPGSRPGKKQGLLDGGAESWGTGTLGGGRRGAMKIMRVSSQTRPHSSHPQTLGEQAN